MRVTVGAPSTSPSMSASRVFTGSPPPWASSSWTEDHSSLQSSAREGAEAILDLLQAEEPVTARRRRLRTRAVRGSLALVGALGAALAVRSGRRDS